MTMELRACCCVKPRTGALIAGLTDLVLGLIGILGIIFHQLEYFDSMESSVTVDTGDVSGAQDGNQTILETNSTSVTDVPDANYTMIENSGSISALSADDTYSRWNAVVCLYAFAAICAVLHGILVLIAAARKQSFFNGAALVENLLMILGCLGGTVALFILGYHWLDLTLMPFIIALQIYFLWVGHDYQKYFSYSQPINVKARA